MPVAAPPPPTRPPRRPPVAVSPGRRSAPNLGREPDCTAAWTLVGVLCGFKIVTIGLIFVLAQPTANLGPMLFAMNWVWLVPLSLVLSVVPFAFWFRLLRARSRRRRLQRSEWHVENAPGW